jgi:hypothetical protein
MVLVKFSDDHPQELNLPEVLLALAAFRNAWALSKIRLTRIGIMRALNRHVERVFNLERKTAIAAAASWRGTRRVRRAGISLGFEISRFLDQRSSDVRISRRLGELEKHARLASKIVPAEHCISPHVHTIIKQSRENRNFVRNLLKLDLRNGLWRPCPN